MPRSRSHHHNILRLLMLTVAISAWFAIPCTPTHHLFAEPSVALADPVAFQVIGNAASVPPNLDPKQVREIFWGTVSFIGSTHAVPIIYDHPLPIQNSFFSEVLRSSEKAFNAHWVKMVFRGAATAPRKVHSPQDALALLAHLPGAIAVVPPGPLPEGVVMLFSIPAP